MNDNTGGPAFPAHHFDLAMGEHGMTLRDYFAAMALPRVMQDGKKFSQIAEDAYDMADAMLRVRRE